MAILDEQKMASAEKGVQGINLDVDECEHEAGDLVGHIKSPQTKPLKGMTVHAMNGLECDDAPSQKPPSLDVEQLAHEEEHDTLAHLSSPQAKPMGVDSSSPDFPDALQLPEQQHAKGGMNKKGLSGLSKRFQSMNDFSKVSEIDDEDAAPSTSTEEHGAAASQREGEDVMVSKRSPTLTHTVGTLSKTLKRSQSELAFQMLEEPEEDTRKETAPSADAEEKLGSKLLVVFDMDRTMVGDLVALSDRDNVETNVTWTYWPEGENKGLGVEEIVPYLKRGMMRPGLLRFIAFLRSIGATIVVYTHSELKWASKVCAAMEEVAGYKFIDRLFTRKDCKDGHPEFISRKNLQMVVDTLRAEDGRLAPWVSVERAVMFDDDGGVLAGGEQVRLVRVPAYDYWEPCPWDTRITPEVLAKNTDEAADLVRRSVVEWGIARPSFAKQDNDITEEERAADAKWLEHRSKKEKIQLSYNKVAKLDMMWMSVLECFSALSTLDDDDMEILPVRLRKALGHSAKPLSRRR